MDLWYNLLTVLKTAGRRWKILVVSSNSFMLWNCDQSSSFNFCKLLWI